MSKWDPLRPARDPHTGSSLRPRDPHPLGVSGYRATKVTKTKWDLDPKWDPR